MKTFETAFMAAVLAGLLRCSACGGATRDEGTHQDDAAVSPNEDVDGGNRPAEASKPSPDGTSSEMDSGVVDSAPIDGSAGEGCTYVSGDYAVSNGNRCDSIIISCPSDVDASRVNCADICPRAGSATAVQCGRLPNQDSGGGTVLMSCLAPACQA